MKEERVSGNIWARPESYKREGEVYVIRDPILNQGWGLPVEHTEPADLRALADRIEEKRKFNGEAT